MRSIYGISPAMLKGTGGGPCVPITQRGPLESNHRQRHHHVLRTELLRDGGLARNIGVAVDSRVVRWSRHLSVEVVFTNEARIWRALASTSMTTRAPVAAIASARSVRPAVYAFTLATKTNSPSPESGAKGSPASGSTDTASHIGSSPVADSPARQECPCGRKQAKPWPCAETDGVSHMTPDLVGGKQLAHCAQHHGHHQRQQNQGIIDEDCSQDSPSLIPTTAEPR